MGDESRNMMGSECSGIVVEVGNKVSHCHPGDRVVSLSKHCFASIVVADAQTVTHLPERLSFSEGASVPLTFLTSDYALSELARLKKGERVLIHSATGGIGLAAVQLAQKIGAEIYATAGSDVKRDYLRSIGVEHVMNSRSLDFVDEVKEITDGEGVDVVLNALAGEFIPASLGLLRPFGRFIEIGKRDIYADTKLGLYPFRNNIAYFGADLGQFATHRRLVLKKMLDKMMKRFASGELKPSPLRIFSMREAGKGFEFMARAQHIGKIVFRVEERVEESEVAMEKFRSRFGTGIGLQEGLSVFQRLISSEQTPSCVTVVADPLRATDTVVRHQAQTQAVRPVDTPFTAPRNHSEELLQQIWEKNLGVSPIGVDDDFVDLGGDSVNAIMIQVAVEATFDVDLTMSVLFSHSSIAELAGLINEQSATPE
jgi:NADPH:quinone reductase-like Zn-dependent oxidoreductase/acyl carrier protein